MDIMGHVLLAAILRAWGMKETPGRRIMVTSSLKCYIDGNVVVRG
jgi:hypothetical protein